MQTHEFFGEPVYTYTRAQAIDDGELVSLTAWAKETGFTVPVVITRAAWADFIEWPESAKGFGQSERGRAHDVLWMLLCAIRAGRGGERVDFKVSRLIPGASGHARPGNLYALSHGGDNGEHVITVMLPEED
jgi:hypothetical protein